MGSRLMSILAEQRVEDVLRHEAVFDTLPAWTPLVDALAYLYRLNRPFVPVLDEGGNVKGVLERSRAEMLVAREVVRARASSALGSRDPAVTPARGA